MYTRIFNTSLATFSKEAFRNWQEELNSLAEEIPAAEKELENDKKALSDLQTQLQKELESFINENDILHLPEKIKIINAQINLLSYPDKLKHLQNSLNKNEKKLGKHQLSFINIQQELQSVCSTIKKIENGIEIGNSLIEINHLKQKLNSYTEQKKSTSERLDDIQKKLIEYKSNYDRMQFQLATLMLLPSTSMDKNYYSEQTNPPNYDDRFATREEKLNEIIHNEYDKNRKNNILKMEAESQLLLTKISDLENEKNDLITYQKMQPNTQEKLIKKLNVLKHKVSDLEKKGYSFQGNLIELKENLEEKNNEKNKLEITNSQLRKKLAKKNKENFSLEIEIAKLQEDHDKDKGILKKLPNFTPNSNQSSLQHELTKALTLSSEYEMKKEEQLKKEIEQTQKVNSDKEKIYYLSTRQNLLNSNVFLNKLRDNPETLTLELTNSLKNNLTHFERNNPINQPLHTRILLTDIKNKIDFILTDTTDKRTMYYRLNGLITHATKQLIWEDKLLRRVLKKTLEDHPIDTDEAQAEYLNYAKLYPHQLKFITEENQNRDTLKKLQYDHEYNEYKKTHQRFSNLLQQQNPNISKPEKKLHQTGQALLNTIDHERMIAENKNMMFDLKYHTILLNKAMDLFKEPESNSLQHEFHFLANFNKQGVSSYKKQIAGAALMFLGSALSLACGAMNYLTFNFSAPFTTVGLASGVSLFGAGFTLFANGREREPAKQIRQFENAASHITNDTVSQRLR